MTVNQSDIFRERPPLSGEDCFVVFDRRKTSFTFPIHVHPEFELNYVEGASGAKRIIGDSLENIGEQDLVLIANPELKHAWLDGEHGHSEIHEITIQFHPSLIEHHLDKKQFYSMQQLIFKAARGVVFGKETVNKVLPLLKILTLELEKDGFYSVMKLFIILYELSKSEDVRMLSSTTRSLLSENEILMNRLQAFIAENMSGDLSLPTVADSLNMSTSTFSRFMKKAANMSYTDYLLQSRVNLSVRKLKEDLPIGDIVDICGFNSTSYFYRVFKKQLGMTPIEYRNKYKKQQTVI